MRFATKEQLQDVVEYMGNNIHVPQLVQHFDAENIYSIDEQVVGCWIDGRPIYQKVITGSWSINGTSWTDISEPSTNKGTCINAWALIADNKYSYPVICAINGGTAPMQIKATNSGYSGTAKTVVLQYTKTTDAANSYNIAKENDYCMQERIIGTWEDDEGKNLLCRKTYKITIPTTQTANSLDTLVETFTKNVFPLKVEALQFNPGKFAAASNSFYTNDWPSVNVYTDGTYKKLTVSIQGLDVNNYKGCAFYVVVDYIKGN